MSNFLRHTCRQLPSSQKKKCVWPNKFPKLFKHRSLLFHHTVSALRGSKQTPFEVYIYIHIHRIIYIIWYGYHRVCITVGASRILCLTASHQICVFFSVSVYIFWGTNINPQVRVAHSTLRLHGARQTNGNLRVEPNYLFFACTSYMCSASIGVLLAT